MTEIEAIKELKEDISLYDNEITRLDASIGTPDRNLIDALEMAIKSLEKQIPKKPKERDCIGFNTLVCPVCKDALYLYEPYCDNCGQKLDWS